VFTTRVQRGRTKLRRIEVATATVGDFEAWLKDADLIEADVCIPVVRAKTAEPTKAKPERAKSQTQEKHPPGASTWYQKNRAWYEENCGSVAQRAQNSFCRVTHRGSNGY
jgi:hypothetical protein